jgi:hypothetical protein
LLATIERRLAQLAFHERERLGRDLRQLRGDFAGALEQRFGLHHCIDEAAPHRLVQRQRRAGDRRSAATPSDVAARTISSAMPGNGTPTNSSGTPSGRGRWPQAPIASASQNAAAGDRVAIDRRDGRLREREQSSEAGFETGRKWSM